MFSVAVPNDEPSSDGQRRAGSQGRVVVRDPAASPDLDDPDERPHHQPDVPWHGPGRQRYDTRVNVLGGATDMTFNFFLLTFSARSTHLIFLFFRWQNVRQGPRGDFAGERREAEPAVGDRAAVSGSERLSLHSASPQRCFNSASLARILPQRTATALWCHLSQCLRPRDSCSNRREWRTSSARKKLHQTVERFCKVRLYHVRNGDRNEASECLDLLRRPGFITGLLESKNEMYCLTQNHSFVYGSTSLTFTFFLLHSHPSLVWIFKPEAPCLYVANPPTVGANP